MGAEAGSAVPHGRLLHPLCGETASGAGPEGLLGTESESYFLYGQRDQRVRDPV